MAFDLSPDDGRTARVRVLRDHDAACRAAAEAIADRAVRSVAESGRFTWALTGGSTAAGSYRALAEKPLCDRVPWQRCELFLGDERWVPADDEHSNYRMVRESLLAGIQVRPGGVFPIPTDAGSPEEGARLYETILLDRLLSGRGDPGDGAPPRFDLVLLGLGVDGHVASLYSGSPALEVVDRWVVAVEAPETAPIRNRVTLTFPVIEASDEIVFLVTGGRKSSAVADVLEGATTAPAARLAGHPRAFWYLDAAAAAGLRHRTRT